MHPRPVGSRVLLVEDVPAMRMLLRLALERAGMEVIEAADLAQARRALRAGPAPTCVLLDLELPDGNGLDLVGELPNGVPVAALTADDSRETALRCRAAGCATLVSKGERLANPAGIVRAIEALAPEPRAHSAPDPELLWRYVAYLDEARLELQRAHTHGDFNAVRKVAHRLRGTAVHFGYAGIGAGARSLSEAIAAGRAENIGTAIAALGERLGEAIRDAQPA
jgi:CheY-like chemotaxis protein